MEPFESAEATPTFVARVRHAAQPSTTALAQHASLTHRADLAQHGLTEHFGGLRAGSLRSSSPPRLRDLAAFDYWWLAHAIEVRLDAYARSGHPKWLILAQKTYAGIRRRNRGSLFNDYFDDMSWLAIAALRLFDATTDARYFADAEALWRHIVRHGLSDRGPHGGTAIAWRRQQPRYTNAPTNGSFGILSARLFAHTGSSAYRAFAESSLRYLDTVLRDEGSGYLADGINRAGDGAIDSDWDFSYNQGLYLGCQLEAFERTGEQTHLVRALRTARRTIDSAPHGVITGENVDGRTRGGGDIGLFKGVFYRYAADLAAHPAVRGDRDFAADRDALTGFLVDSTDQLWSTFAPSLLASDDWRFFATGRTALSTELSAVIALEASCRLNAAVSAAEVAAS